MLLWNQGGPSQDGLGAALWGSVLCVRWAVASSHTRAILPGAQLPVSSARRWDRVLAVLTALDTGPPWAALACLVEWESLDFPKAALASAKTGDRKECSCLFMPLVCGSIPRLSKQTKFLLLLVGTLG